MRRSGMFRFRLVPSAAPTRRGPARDDPPRADPNCAEGTATTAPHRPGHRRRFAMRPRRPPRSRTKSDPRATRHRAGARTRHLTSRMVSLDELHGVADHTLRQVVSQARSAKSTRRDSGESRNLVRGRIVAAEERHRRRFRRTRTSVSVTGSDFPARIRNGTPAHRQLLMASLAAI